MALDQKTVKRIAWLARIRLEDAEVESMSHELTRIIDWVEQLAEVDTEDVAPMTSVVALELRRRADLVTEGGDLEPIVGNAPDQAQGFFAVPKVLE